jgi:hypothetical protein
MVAVPVSHESGRFVAVPKNLVTIPADPIGLSWFLAGWSLIALSVAVMLWGLFERSARREKINNR